MASKPHLATTTLLLLLLISTIAISNASFFTTLGMKTNRYNKGLNIHQGASVARRHGGVNNIPGLWHSLFNFLPKGGIVPPSGPSPCLNQILNCVRCVNSASYGDDEVPNNHPSKN